MVTPLLKMFSFVCYFIFQEDSGILGRTGEKTSGQSAFQGISAFMCCVCRKVYKRRKNLHVHVKAVHQDTWNVCEICHKKFMCKDTLKDHVKQHWSPNLFCQICNKFFNHQKTYKDHILSHGANFECTKCGKKYKFISSLRKHTKKDVCWDFIFIFHSLTYTMNTECTLT